MICLVFALLFGTPQPNALIDEDSPYLRQHAHNPVQRQRDVLSTAIAHLMHTKGVVVLKHSREVLLSEKGAIAALNFSYVLTKTDDACLCLACNIGACFVYDKKFSVVKEAIEVLADEK